MNANLKANQQNIMRKKSVRRNNIHPKAARALMAPKGLRVRGKGAYSLGDFWDTISTPFKYRPSEGKINSAARALGTAVGNATGLPIGTYTGNAASWLSRVMGAGKYTIKQNSLFNQQIATFAPNSNIRKQGREFIGNVVGTSEFSSSKYIINPGNEAMFPLLCRIAACFETYRWHGLVLEYRATSAFATGTGNSGLGTVIMATDYDVIDAAYNSKKAMTATDFSGTAPPNESFYHFVECDPQQNVQKNMYIQSGNSKDGYPDDPRFSSVGLFQIATEGMQTSNAVGELWVSYDVEFFKPQLQDPTAAGLASLYSGGTLSTNYEVPYRTGDFSSASIQVNGVHSGTSYLRVSALPVGRYMVVCDVAFAEGTISLPGLPDAIPEPGAVIIKNFRAASGLDNRTSYSAGINTIPLGIPNPNGTSKVCFQITDPTGAIHLPLPSNTDAGTTWPTHYNVVLTKLNEGFSAPLSAAENNKQQLIVAVLAALKGEQEMLPQLQRSDTSCSSAALTSHNQTTYDAAETPHTTTTTLPPRLVIDQSKTDLTILREDYAKPFGLAKYLQRT